MLNLDNIEESVSTNTEFDVGAHVMLLVKMVKDKDRFILERLGIDDSCITDPITLSIYKKLVDYYDKRSAFLPEDGFPEYFTPEELDFWNSIRNNSLRPDSEIRDRLWDDKVFNQIVGVINTASDIMQKDAGEAVQYIKGKLQTINPSVSSIGTDIVALSEDRYKTYKEKQKSESWFYPTGFPQLDSKIGGFSPGEDLTVLFARTGVGKEQPLYSKVLTPTGWKTMGDINVGDTVISGSGRSTKVLATFPQGIKPVYQINFDDGTSVDAGMEHLWKVRRKVFNKLGKPDVLTTKQLMSSYNKYVIENVGKFDIEGDDSFEYLSYMFGLFVSKGKVLSIKDGKLTLHMENIPYTLNSGMYFELCDISSSFSNHAIDDKKKTESYDIAINISSVFGKYVMNYMNHNHDFAINSSYNSRLSLLRGIMDAGGTSSSIRKNSRLVTGSYKLANLTEDISRSLGNRTLVGLSKPDKYCIDIYSAVNVFRFSDYAKKWKCCNKLYKNITSISYKCDFECKCIMVDDIDHTYVTDDYTVTHNTWVLTKMLTESWRNGFNVGLIEPEMTSVKIGYRFDTIFGHIPNKEVMQGMDIPGFEGDKYHKYLESLRIDHNNKFMVAHPGEFGDSITVSKIRSWVQNEDIKFLAIDGISYMKDERALPSDSMTTALTHISADLMTLSVELKIPVLIVVQANREGAMNGGKLALENIRDSDGIAYSASKVISLFKKNECLHIELLKNRDGESDCCLVYSWDINTGKFEFLQEGEVDEDSDPSSGDRHTYSRSDSSDNSRRPDRTARMGVDQANGYVPAPVVTNPTQVF